MSYNFDKDFEDRSWQHMRALLDREMPEDKRKRRFAYWWWVGGGLLLAGILGYGFYHFNKNKKDIPAQKPIALEAPMEQGGLSNAKIAPSLQGESYGHLKAENSAQLSKNSTFLENSTNRIPPPQLKTDKFNNTKNERLYEKKDNTSISFNNDILKNNKAYNVENKDNISQNNSELKPEGNIVSENKAVDNIPPQLKSENSIQEIRHIELLAELDREIPELKIDRVLPPIVKQNIITPDEEVFERRFVWGINIGTHSNRLRNFDGYHAGLIAVYPLSKKLGLTAGLSYRATKAYGDSLTYTRFEANSISGGFPMTTNFNVVNGKTLILNKLQYVEMPLNLHFNLNKKWSMFGGVKMSYLINEQVKYQGDTTVFVVLTADRKAQKDQAFSGAPSAKTLRLNKWATALTGGFRYRFNAKVSATLRYDFDLKSISQNANNGFYNRYLGLDLSYYFK